ncbi:MAG: hypothetical protein AAGE52_39000 [Myxococcota bacterium]
MLRSESLDVEATAYYHLMSRCVRRAFLCGKDPHTGQDFEYRRGWVEERLLELSAIFAVDLHAYAVMSNHLHVVLRVDKDRAESWSDQEVTRRYGKLFRSAVAELAQLSARERKARVVLWRERLWSLSWLMRCLNESIARRANAEDECKGRFWEGRFRCQPLLDENALLACMAYVDLNPVRAGLAKSPEASEHTSFAKRVTEEAPAGLVPFADEVPERSRRTTVPIGADDYRALLAWTARTLRAPTSKRGVPEVFGDLGIHPPAFLAMMNAPALRALGSPDQLQAFAEAHGKRWVHGTSQSRKLYVAAES